MSSRQGWKWMTMALIAALVVACAPSVADLLETGDVAGLVELLGSDAAVDARADAASALGALGDSAAVDPLIAALADPDASLRAAAADALGLLADDTAVAPLLATIADGDEAVRIAARAALAQLSEAIDGDALVSILVDALGDDVGLIRATAADLLGQSGERAALSPLLGAVGDGDEEVTRAVTVALDRLIADLGGAAQPVLIAALEEDGATRRAAIEALAETGDASAVPPLLLAMTDDASEVGAAAQSALADVLARQSGDEAVAILLEAVEDERTTVSEAAAAVLTDLLGRLGPGEASAALVASGASDGWLAIGLGIDESQLAAETRRLNLQLDPIDEIFAVASGVPESEGAEGAHAYEASDGYHPAVVLGATFGVPESWAPTATRYLELVVVEDDITWTQIEECLYDGPSIIRYRGTQTVRVLSAADGSLVAEEIFQGPDPRACAPSEAYWLTELYGEDPDLTPAVEWLESIIHSPS